MRKPIYLLRSTDGDPDSRLQKYLWYFENHNIPFKAICWDRNLKKNDTNSYCYFHRKAGYGLGLTNIKGLFLFNWFILKQLIKNRKNIGVIHAADLDTVIPATIMHIFFGKKVIYDIYDWYIDSRGIKNPVIKSIVKAIEFFNIKSADRVIVCEPERIKQIVFKPRYLWVLPNIPSFSNRVSNNKTKTTRTNNLTISYVGVLGYERGLENLIRLARENQNINVTVAGFGPLANLFKEGNDKGNLKFCGSVSYKEALDIMGSSDIIYACYETTNPNHKLAAPNKYYEGLYLGTPIITTKGTIVGDKTIKYNTGYAIDESYEGLKHLIEQITPEDILTKQQLALSLWENKYSSFFDNFMDQEYLNFIRKFDFK